jgi:uncharacterized membrane protein HdeD (DUF308 family)
MRWNGPFRCLAGVLGALATIVGIMVIMNALDSRSFRYDHNFRFGIASLGYGILFIVAAIRGRLFGKS